MHEISGVYPFLVNVCIALVAIGFLNLGGLLVIVFAMETPQGMKPTSPFNLLLFAMITSSIAHAGLEIVSIQLVSDGRTYEYPFARGSQLLTLSMWEISYMKYCWLRTEEIVLQSLPTYYKRVKSFVLIIPFLCLLQPIPQIVSGFLANNPSSITINSSISSGFAVMSGLIIFLFDALLLAAFYIYLTKSPPPRLPSTNPFPTMNAQENITHIQSTSVTLNRSALDPKLVIIARHGIVVSCFGWIALVIYVIFVVGYERYLLVCIFLLNCINFVLLAMKVKLLRQRKGEVSAVRAQVQELKVALEADEADRQGSLPRNRIRS